MHGTSVGYLLCGPERWIVDRGPIYTERLFIRNDSLGRRRKRLTNIASRTAIFKSDHSVRCVILYFFMVWPVLLCSRARYASISLALYRDNCDCLVYSVSQSLTI